MDFLLLDVWFLFGVLLVDLLLGGGLLDLLLADLLDWLLVDLLDFDLLLYGMLVDLLL